MPRGRLSAKKRSAKKHSAKKHSSKKRSASRRSASRRSASTRFRGETGLTPALETNTSPTLAKKIKMRSILGELNMVVEFDLNRTAGELLQHVKPYFNHIFNRKLGDKTYTFHLLYHYNHRNPAYKWDNEDNDTKLSQIIDDKDKNPFMLVWERYEKPLFRTVTLSRMSTGETRRVKVDLNHTVGKIIEAIKLRLADYDSRSSEPLQELEEIQLVHLDKNLEYDRRLSEYIDAEEENPLIFVRETFEPRDKEEWMSWVNWDKLGGN